jgi:ATP-dependent Lon protease
MNKRKPDDEFALINLSYFRADGTEVTAWCPESKHAAATQEPVRRGLAGSPPPAPVTTPAAVPAEPVGPAAVPAVAVAAEEMQTPAPAAAVGVSAPKERHYTILYGDTGHSYDTIFGDYLEGAKEVVVEDPYIRLTHQVNNFVRFCEAVVRRGTVRKITLVTAFDDDVQQVDVEAKLADLGQSLLDFDVSLHWKVNPKLHDREVQLDNGWTVKIGRGLDIYQKPQSWFEIGSSDLSLRKCLETKVDVFRTGKG